MTTWSIRMPLLQIQQLQYALPDGSQPFPALSHAFPFRRTGLVGRNGCGKSLLGQLLAGQLAPHAGHVLREGGIHRLSQELDPDAHPTAAHLAGMAETLAALQRVRGGSLDERDYQLLQDRWDCESSFQQLLSDAGLNGMSPDTPSATLSGGERQRIALRAALRSGADWLILDEPSNHLDLPHRAALRDSLRHWTGGLVLISHDASLLEWMDDIAELSRHGLRGYGCGYAGYLIERDRMRSLSQSQLQAQRQAERQLKRRQQQERERQQKRASRGERQAEQGNQSKLITDAQKDRSQQSQGKLLLRQQHARERQRAVLLEAQARADDAAPPSFNAPGCELPATKLALELEGVRLPRGARALIDLRLAGPERLAIIGANGSGKSTLLRVIAGQLQPSSGLLRRHVAAGWLDQHAGSAQPGLSPCQWLQSLSPGMSETDARIRLAQLGLSAEQASRPSAALSGGEAMRVALAARLCATPAPQLLLLDEPDNHLDRDSRDALLAMLAPYRGALLAVSHDLDFLAKLRPDRWLWLKTDSPHAWFDGVSQEMLATLGW
ncbi:ATP-binding cassette domain-containing protein [Chromobacterium vaccinii]|uniref:ATP-binding cassette domain-containing protein n=2 Tax=Chromobacterium vaccinii TaxID=1108595 RepID=UPI001E54D748|nr:ATP-binding cassette domain-containing protein [Chromobacterium vaccinii]MCD4502186.1 ATP-binding cassette domain-containing protein [Chromobacterium vaccinii]